MKLFGTYSSAMTIAAAAALVLGLAPFPTHATDAPGEIEAIGTMTLRGSYENAIADLHQEQDNKNALEEQQRELKGGDGGRGGGGRGKRAKKVGSSVVDDRVVVEQGAGNLGKKVNQQDQKVKKVKNNAAKNGKVKQNGAADRVGGWINRAGEVCEPNVPVGGCTGCVPIFDDVKFMVPCTHRCTSSKVCARGKNGIGCCTDFSRGAKLTGYQFCNEDDNTSAGCMPE